MCNQLETQAATSTATASDEEMIELKAVMVLCSRASLQSIGRLDHLPVYRAGFHGKLTELYLGLCITVLG